MEHANYTAKTFTKKPHQTGDLSAPISKGHLRMTADEAAPQIGIFAYATLNRLIHHADERGVCWPKIATLAKDLGIGRRTVERALNRLEAAGLVERRENRRYGRQVENFYRLTVRHTDAPRCATQTHQEQEHEEQGRKVNQEIPILYGLE